MKNINLTILFILLLIVSSACEEELMNTEVTTNVPVIEAYMHGGDESMEIKVSTLAPYNENADGVQNPISGLEIKINENNIEYVLIESAIPGTYHLAESVIFNVVPQQEITLNFEYNGDIIGANTIVPEKPSNFNASETVVSTYRIPEGSFSFPSINNIEYTWDNSEGDYYLVTMEFMEETQDLINENMADLEEDFPTITTSRVLEDDIYNINARQILFFGTYRIILYKVNEEYVNILDSETQNSQSLTNPLTNVENGWGIFTAINSDTVYLEVIED